MTAVVKEKKSPASRHANCKAMTQLVQKGNAFGIYWAERFKRQRNESVRIRQRLVLSSFRLAAPSAAPPAD